MDDVELTVVLELALGSGLIAIGAVCRSKGAPSLGDSAGVDTAALLGGCRKLKALTELV